jgi:hypothetical protein
VICGNRCSWGTCTFARGEVIKGEKNFGPVYDAVLFKNSTSGTVRVLKFQGRQQQPLLRRAACLFLFGIVNGLVQS